MIALWCVLALGPCTLGADAPTLEEPIDRYLAPYNEIGHLSASLLVARGDEVLYEKSFGSADLEHAVPITTGTKFCIGSVNKPMTIVIAARLIELDKLALTDPLSKFLPAFPRADEITVDHMLDHRAGIPHRVTDPIDETRPQTPASMVALAARRSLVFAPGSDSVYSSAGFSVLARVLELAGGKPYAELLADHLLKPAGMTETSDAGTRAILEGRASSYAFDTDGLLNTAPEDVSYLVGAGSVYSTPRDLLSMQRALLDGRLGVKAREALVHENGDLRWNGLAAGFRAFADHDAASGITVIVASNLVSGALDRIRQALPKIAAGEPVAPPAPIRAEAVAVDPRRLASYAGAYQLRPGRNLELRIVDGRVRMNEWLLIPTSPTTLFSPQDYAEIEVVFGDDGRVTRLDWTTGGGTYPLPRVDTTASE
jgi:CubicO group peptidase (beta-lactamase class C family)